MSKNYDGGGEEGRGGNMSLRHHVFMSSCRMTSGKNVKNRFEGFMGLIPFSPCWCWPIPMKFSFRRWSADASCQS